MKKLIMLVAVFCLFNTVVFAQSQVLPLAPANVPAPVVNAQTWLDQMSTKTTFAIAHTMDFKGEFGTGIATNYKLGSWVSKNQVWEIDYGPYYAFSQMFNKGQNIRNFVGVAAWFKPLNATTIDTWFHKLPGVGAIPVDLGTSQLSIGLGYNVDYCEKPQVKDMAITVGWSFKWGK